MIENKDKAKVVPGTLMRCIAADNYRNLTEGLVYKCLHGLEAGIFETSPFVTVVGDNGALTSYHASRFELLEEA